MTAPHPSDPSNVDSSQVASGGQAADVHTSDAFAAEDEGLHKGLTRGQIQMIAMGSAIGTGLFLGSGSRLEAAGPSLAILYLICGFAGYLILRSLGELISHRPASGSFVAYSRQFFGEGFAYVSGWFYWFFWAMTAVADSTAVAIYIHWFGRYISWLASIPQWAYALLVVVLVLVLNLVSVKLFGIMEFWFSAIKVLALTFFLLIGIGFLIFSTPNGSQTGLSLITDHGGLLPNGLMPALVVTQGVVFAYSGIELIGTASGEAKNPQKEIPKAINLVILRIILFYFGSIVLLCMLLPSTAYHANESPFVTFFASIGIDAAAPIMQLIIITAALSSLNAGLYSTGRIMRSLALAGSAPKFAAKLTKSGVPFGGILMTCAVAFVGVGLNYVLPGQAFEIMLNLAAIGVIAGWATISLSHMRFVRLCRDGVYDRPEYRAPFAPVINYVTLAFLAGVVLLMAFDYPVGTWTLVVSLIFWLALAIGWWFIKRQRVA